VATDMWNGKSFGYLENEKIVTVTCKDCSCFFCLTGNSKACVCILQYTKGYKALSPRKLNYVAIYMSK